MSNHNRCRRCFDMHRQSTGHGQALEGLRREAGRNAPVGLLVHLVQLQQVVQRVLHLLRHRQVSGKHRRYVLKILHNQTPPSECVDFK
jgi:hypothetical protein